MPTGSCHCGQVEYEVPETLGDGVFCYCQTCRKLTGTAFASVAPVAEEDFKITKGKELLCHYESSPGKFRYFCSHCHSPIYVQMKPSPEVVRIRLGSLNFEPKVNITKHIWVSEKPEWYSINDDLLQFEEF